MARGAIIPPSLAHAAFSERAWLRSRTNQRNPHMADTTTPAWLESIERISEEVIAPADAEIDSAGIFPRVAITEMGKAGLLGLISAREVGGLGEGHRAATRV